MSHLYHVICSKETAFVEKVLNVQYCSVRVLLFQFMHTYGKILS